MLRIFQREQSFTSIFLFLLALSVIFFISPAKENMNTLPLSGSHIEIHWAPWFSKISALLLILITAAFMVRLNVVYNFIRVRTYLPAFFYVLLVVPITKGRVLEPALYTVPAILAILFTLFRSFKQKGVAYNYFYAGLLLGVTSMLYAPAIFYIIFIYISMSLLRSFNWRETVYPLLGVLIIYYLFWGTYYVTDIPFSPVIRFFQSLFHQSVQTGWNIMETVFLGLTGFIIVVSSLHIISVIMGKKVYSRRIFLIFWWMFLIGLVLYLLIPGVGKDIIYYMAIPVSFLLAHYFSNVRPGIFNELLFLAFTATSLLTIFDFL